MSIRRTTRSEDAMILKRLRGCLPASRFEMDTLTRLAGVETTYTVPTAAVECKRRPRLLINPEFVNRYCQRDEHLFLLIMHELWHVMLAHTRMYPRMTLAQNIAFDAIINSGLMREFEGPEYRGFFDVINPADTFPSCLLRPPVGWPYDPQYPEGIGPVGTTEMIKRLYPIGNFSFDLPPLYEEVLALLLKAGGKIVEPMLLGNHHPEQVHDPILKDLMKQVTERWPDNVLFKQNQGTWSTHRNYGVQDVGENTRRVFSKVLQVCISLRHGRERNKEKRSVPDSGGAGVIPNPRDRLSPARARLGMPETLWNQPSTVKARLSEPSNRAFIYLDVSGSMSQLLSYLLGLMVPYVVNHQAYVFQFSTLVTDLPLPELKQGRITTTNGTDINCVFEHLFTIAPKIPRVLILTDGEVGAIKNDYIDRLQTQAIKLYVVMPESGELDPTVESIATSVIRLPPLY
ncbi:MAG: hypothetical protein MUF87_01900 [Anaerolineae bacterium]|jgi:hypothetical protein|nr:hypothetical protein [Anaerolineae bacterium]